MNECKYCGNDAKHDRRVCRMRKLNADPEFARAHAERMRKLHADPEFARANAERMRKVWALAKAAK